MSQIPQERDILKQDLWKRIDNTWEQTNNLAKEIYANVDKVREGLMAYYEKVVEAYGKYKAQLADDNKANFIDLKRVLNAISDDNNNILILRHETSLADLKNFIATKVEDIGRMVDGKLIELKEMEKKINTGQDELIKKQINALDSLDTKFSKEIAFINEDLKNRFNQFSLINLEIKKQYDIAIESANVISEQLRRDGVEILNDYKSELFGSVRDEVEKLNLRCDAILKRVESEVSNFENYNDLVFGIEFVKNNITDIWGAIDNEIDGRKKKWEELNNKILEINKGHSGAYDNLVKEVNKLKEELIVFSNNELVGVKKELEKFVQNEINRLILNQNDFLKKIDDKIKIMNQQVNDRVNTEIEFRMNTMIQTAQDTDRKVDVFEKGMKKAMANYQNELMEKFNEMRLKFERVISNMKSLSGMLSK